MRAFVSFDRALQRIRRRDRSGIRGREAVRIIRSSGGLELTVGRRHGRFMMRIGKWRVGAGRLWQEATAVKCRHAVAAAIGAYIGGSLIYENDVNGHRVIPTLRYAMVHPELAFSRRRGGLFFVNSSGQRGCGRANPRDALAAIRRTVLPGPNGGRAGRQDGKEQQS